MVVTATEEQSLMARLRRLIDTGRSDGEGNFTDIFTFATFEHPIAHFHRELARLAG
jgi:hypothetical protein